MQINYNEMIAAFRRWITRALDNQHDHLAEMTDEELNDLAGALARLSTATFKEISRRRGRSV